MDLPDLRPSVPAEAAGRAARRARADVDVLLAESRFRLSLSQDLLDELRQRRPRLTSSAADPS